MEWLEGIRGGFFFWQPPILSLGVLEEVLAAQHPCMCLYQLHFRVRVGQ